MGNLGENRNGTKGMDNCWELSLSRSRKIRRLVTKNLKLIVSSVQSKENFERCGVLMDFMPLDFSEGLSAFEVRRILNFRSFEDVTSSNF